MNEKKLKMVFIMTIIIIIILFTLVLTVFNLIEGMNNYTIYNSNNNMNHI